MSYEGNKKQKKNPPAGWKPYDGKNLYNPNLWHPGDPLTEEDNQMLDEIRKVYRELGYVPSRREVPTVSAVIKRRFRLWSIALQAAGLPDYKDLEEVRKRMAIMEARKWEKETQQHRGESEEED